jgi:hypothetical protein
MNEPLALMTTSFGKPGSIDDICVIIKDWTHESVEVTGVLFKVGILCGYQFSSGMGKARSQSRTLAMIDHVVNYLNSLIFDGPEHLVRTVGRSVINQQHLFYNWLSEHSGNALDHMSSLVETGDDHSETRLDLRLSRHSAHRCHPCVSLSDGSRPPTANLIAGYA